MEEEYEFTRRDSIFNSDYKDYSLVIDGKNLKRILDHYCPSGNFKAAILEPEINQIIKYCRVYARTTPEQKKDIVELTKLVKAQESTLVGFCGDGANDILALKAADIGLSLSTEEASLAAPFVSLESELTCVIDLLTEGRGSLVNSFQNFKYLLFYSMSQCFGAVICLVLFIDISPLCYIWMDIFLAVPLTLLISNLGSKKRLTTELPPDSLLQMETLLSYSSHLIFSFFALFGGIMLIRWEPFYFTPNEYFTSNNVLPHSLDGTPQTPFYEPTIIA